MNKNKTKPVLTLVLTITVALSLLLPPSHNAFSQPPEPNTDKEFRINAAGATFPFPLIDLWRVEYNELYPNVKLNYQSIGSGGGVKNHIEKTVHFAATDAPLRPSEEKKVPGTLHIPEAIGAVVVSYNVPEVKGKELKLNGPIIADIFLGNIKKWNDERIKDLNPDLSLPDKDIVVAHRSDGSGTTFVFTSYLSEESKEWENNVGAAKSVPWPLGVGSKGNEGVARVIKSTPYTIGYIELAYAIQTDMSHAMIENGDGTGFVKASIETIAAASEKAAPDLPKAWESWHGVNLINAQGKNSYPIATFTYLLVYEEIDKSIKDKEVAQTVVHLIHWMITDGQKYNKELLYVPIADPVKEIGKEGLGRITWNGESLYDYQAPKKDTSSADSSSYDIPQWIKNNAKWWAEGQISDKEYIKALQFLIDKGILQVN